MFALILNFFFLAAGGGEAGGFMETWNKYFNFPGFEAWKFLNLGIFIAIMVYLLKKPLSGAFKAKRDAIRADLIRAEEERKAALAKLSEAETRLANLDSETEKILEKARSESEAERERIIAQAEFEAKRLRDQANAEIARKTKQVMSELRRFSAEESVRRAEEKIKGSMDKSVDERLVKAGISSIGGLS
ncbi:MAG: ATP synthase F0 subunit B [Pyrinomonadaceae bacterium]|nr:ATP synthase F0 subunit B [Pyrinomonadaceae bacterium]